MIESHNPWWKGKDFLKEDSDYRKWLNSKVKWVPSLIRKINLVPFSLHFIIGPRQVGKTTLLKLLIRELLDKNVNPRSIFYYRCDQLADYKELDLVLSEYFKIKKAEGIKTSYIFLDEITFPREWFRTIKLWIDTGRLENDVVVLTGSLSLYARGEIETFPGRRGKGKDFIMYPLSFREFIKIADDRLADKIEKIKDLNITEITDKCFKMRPWIEELNDLFELYLKCGGFPLAVKSLLEHGYILNEVKEVYISWLRGDLIKLKRNESLAKRILKAIIEKSPSIITWNNVAKEFEIRSHKTVFHYIDLFEKLFLVKVLYYFDPNRGILNYTKGKKVHLTDPFLYQVFSEWCLTKRPDKFAVIESIVASHIARKYRVGYWKNKLEIDVVVLIDDKLFGIEVKSKPKVRRRVIGKIKDTIYLTSRLFNLDPLAVPVSIFLACLDV